MKKTIASISTCAIASFIGSVALADAPKAAPTAAHQRLEFFVGEHQIAGTFADGRTFQALEQCEWFDGRFAVVCRASGGSGDKTLSIISYNADEKSYGYWTINSSGMVGRQSGTLQGDTWTFLSDSTTPQLRVVVKPQSATAYALTIDVQGADGRWQQWEVTTYTKK